MINKELMLNPYIFILFLWCENIDILIFLHNIL